MTNIPSNSFYAKLTTDVGGAGSSNSAVLNDVTQLQSDRLHNHDGLAADYTQLTTDLATAVSSGTMSASTAAAIQSDALGVTAMGQSLDGDTPAAASSMTQLYENYCASNGLQPSDSQAWAGFQTMLQNTVPGVYNNANTQTVLNDVRSQENVPSGAGSSSTQAWSTSPYAGVMSASSGVYAGNSLLQQDAQTVLTDLASYQGAAGEAVPSVETTTLHNDELYFWQDKQAADSGNTAALSTDSAEIAQFNANPNYVETYSISSGS